MAGTEQELSALQDYGGALGSSFWIGYRYNSSGTLLSSDVGMEAPTFVSSAVSESASFDNGDCVAVTADGNLTRFACSDVLGYACQFSVTGTACDSRNVRYVVCCVLYARSSSVTLVTCSL